MADTSDQCANPACRIAETGKCVEGLELDKCPHYGKPAASAPMGAESDSAILGVALPNGAALTIETSTEVLRALEARVIAIVGPREAGKTSLIAGLYDLFQRGPVDDIEFARSRTLHAFEMVCHDSRAASRRGVPHMERTRRGEVLFYHLDIGGGPANDGLALLLADRSGEEYSEVADDVAAAEDLSEIPRADCITFLADGARLLDSGQRHNARMEIAMTLNALLEVGAIRAEHRIALVLTKSDLVQASDRREGALADFAALADQLSRILTGRIARLQSFMIAASPETAEIQRGTGIANLLQYWLEKPSHALAPPVAIPKFVRAIARLRPVAE